MLQLMRLLGDIFYNDDPRFLLERMKRVFRWICTISRSNSIFSKFASPLAEIKMRLQCKNFSIATRLILYQA